MIELKAQPNEARCHKTRVTHILSVPRCCPISGNPLAGSEIEISYSPHEFLLEVSALREYVDSYKGGRGDVRSMEGMIQAITQDSANCIGVMVHTVARLNLAPGQREVVECSALVRNENSK